MMVKLVKVVVVTEGGCETSMMSTKNTSASRYVSLLHFCLDYSKYPHPIHSLLFYQECKRV